MSYCSATELLSTAATAAHYGGWVGGCDREQLGYWQLFRAWQLTAIELLRVEIVRTAKQIDPM